MFVKKGEKMNEKELLDTVIPALDRSGIDHPDHYNQGKFEAIDVIEDWKMNFHLGNAVKYIARAGKKKIEHRNEDLEKAIWYIRREIERPMQ